MIPDKFVSRDRWQAGARGATTSSHPIGATQGVTLHWEGPGLGEFTHSACASKVRGIQRFHIDTRKWADIAYNAVVCPHGYVFEGRGIGVKSAANGDEVVNDEWYAVCYLGGVGDGLSRAGKAGLVDAVQWLRAGGAGRLVNGHRDHKATECPGDAIYEWLQVVDFSAGASTSYGKHVDRALEELELAKGGRRRRRRLERVKDLIRSTLAIRK